MTIYDASTYYVKVRVQYPQGQPPSDDAVGEHVRSRLWGYDGGPEQGGKDLNVMVASHPSRTPRIEILHTRDPDSSCGIQVWLDGELIDHSAEESIDPGRGWTREDWDEAVRDTREEHPEYTDAFRQAAIEAWEAFDDNEFVD